jgi:hypothetical protein
MQRGTCFHYLCEIHYRDGIETNQLAAYVEAHEPDLIKYMPEIFPAFLLYQEQFKRSEYDFYIVDGKPAIELEVKIEMTPEIDFWMKFDSIRERNGKLYLFDWKVTGSALTDWFFQKFELAVQTYTYSWAAKELFGDQVAGFFIDAVMINKAGKIGFQPKYFPLVSVLDEHISETVRLGQWIIDHIDDENNFEHRRTGCITKYGRKCQYADVCTAPPHRRESILQSGLYVDNSPIYDF